MIVIMVITDLVAMIVNSAAGGTIPARPLSAVDILLISLGMAIFIILGIQVAYHSYQRRKETQKRVAEWLRQEEERKRVFRERMSAA
jgi:hypothetical protein